MEKVIRDILQRELWQHGTKNDPWLSLERGSRLYSAGMRSVDFARISVIVMPVVSPGGR
jgi:hypothetical protein